MNQNSILNKLQYLKYSPLPMMAKPFYEGLGMILLFHNISPFNGARFLHSGFHQRNISPERLEGIISYFRAKGYSFISLDELYSSLSQGKKTGKFVVFTLDDGMYDNYKYAYPIFKKHNVPFAIYIPTKFINTDAVLWTIPLEEFLLEKEAISLTNRYGNGKMKLESLEEKEVALRRIIHETEVSANESDIYELYELNNWDKYRSAERSYLNWEEVRGLSKDPLCTIGSHTVNHFMLSKISDKESEQELSESKKIIENQIQKPVNHLGYPHGTAAAVGIREFSLAAKCGYKTATTVRYANIHAEHGGFMYCLPRYNIKPAFNDNILDLIRTGTFQFLLKKGKRIVTYK